jgi:hypothetical protein
VDSRVFANISTCSPVPCKPRPHTHAVSVYLRRTHTMLRSATGTHFSGLCGGGHLHNGPRCSKPFPLHFPAFLPTHPHPLKGGAALWLLHSVATHHCGIERPLTRQTSSWWHSLPEIPQIDAQRQCRLQTAGLTAPCSCPQTPREEMIDVTQCLWAEPRWVPRPPLPRLRSPSAPRWASPSTEPMPCPSFHSAQLH